MDFKIAVIKGDGVGPEIISEAVNVLNKVGSKFGHKFNFSYVLAGGAAIDETGVPLPDETLRICKESDSVLLGAVGGPKWDDMPVAKRPEKALLSLRAGLELYANIRPAKIFDAIKEECPLRVDIAENGFDMVIVRELTGGIYFGDRGRTKTPDGEEAYDVERYSSKEIERIGRVAFEMARKRSKRIHSVDKANVLETSRLWRDVMHKLKDEYTDVSYEDILVDNAAMQLVRNPSQFDVLVTSNLFGDILSDEASVITGSIGLLPSASLGKGTLGLYEPIHGSAPDIAGKGIVNPIAAILSTAMMLKYSFGLTKEAESIDNAVALTLESGCRTKDIAVGKKSVSTSDMAEAIISSI